MKLYLLRHGEANWENWTKPDDDRPLTKRGRKEMEAVAGSFKDIKVRPHTILTSPLPRAYETAEIAAEGLEMEFTTVPSLAPGFDAGKLKALLAQYGDRDLMLVGHEPDFSNVIAALTGSNVKLAKAGLARVDLDNPNELHGQLVWLIPPKVMKEI